MGIVNDLKTISNRVLLILQKYPETRDSDKVLWLAYNSIYNDLKGVIASGDYSAFKSWVLKDNTPVFESLSRCRRKLQEQYPELAGKKAERMEIEAEVREMMRPT